MHTKFKYIIIRVLKVKVKRRIMENRRNKRKPTKQKILYLSCTWGPPSGTTEATTQ
jgi:hypothetical protein